ncbi:MAG: 50S ribosomal protein L9 [Alphaproteobacteria bacterium]|nr:50S ribosomal protein L9 [Alphaproteobacteria bacterium]
MQVILLERIEKLGQMGDLVTVKNGFARNYLVPQGKAMRATRANLTEFERRKVELEASNLKHREEAAGVAGKIEGKSVIIIRQAGESGQLFGSVNNRDIAEAFAEDGVTFERRQVRLDQPIKTLGVHEVRVALHPEVDVQVKVNVARSEEEAEIQADPERAAAYAAAQAAEAEEAAAELADMGAELREAEGDGES